MSSHMYSVGDVVHAVVKGAPMTHYTLEIAEVLAPQRSALTGDVFYPYIVRNPKTGLRSHSSDEFLIYAKEVQA